MKLLGKDYDIQIWDGRFLSHDVAIDVETKVRPFTETPDIATFQAFGGGNCAFYVEIKDLAHFFKVHSNSKIIAHNFPFENDVINKTLGTAHFFHDKLEKNLVFDTSILYKLVHLATEGWVPQRSSLDHIAKQTFDLEMSKDDEIRLNFGQFKDAPISSIPTSFLEYGATDAIVTWHLFNDLIDKARQTGSTTLLSHQIQLAGFIALTHLHKNGIGFNQDKRRAFLYEIDTEINTLTEIMGTYGYVTGQKGNKESFKKIMEYYDIQLPLTEDGSLSMAADDLSNYSHNQFVAAFLRYHEIKKAGDFVRPLESSIVHPKYDLLKNTGRTGCKQPNFQNIPREGGIREMYEAQPGHTFIITDYSAIELATLAQITYSRYGKSEMMNRINAGEDLHRFYASVLFNKDADDITKEERQRAKAANFGFPGGLGVANFITYAENYGLQLKEADAREMKDAWFRAFPEMKTYMSEETTDAWTLTGRKRADCTYCAGKNTPFQGLAADGAKIALYYLDHAGFMLRGFIHDEIVTEVREEDANRLLKEQEAIMIKCMKVVVPDVDVKVESMLSKVYCK